MALDGLVIHSIVDELHKKLLGGKIDKVYQHENDEIVLHIRNNKENFKLVLSCSASNPRVYIANEYKKEKNIENWEEILDKYEKRFNFGLESGLSDEEIQKRMDAWVMPEPKIKEGWLSRYARLVTSADEGAILK